MEKEHIGACARCGRDVYCRGGVVEGEVQNDHSLVCPSCIDEEKEESR
ncbi:hypothetical protein G4V62_15160 [Bacillaceae bacterium SIJ1]|nr:hypothetical protein [Litoribacterium kuwaitense]NGP46226.1 hypothetical protein [Litoribacterium kuwaitense]